MMERPTTSLVEALSDSEEYADLTAQSVRGEVQIVGERWLDEGLKRRIFRPGSVENPQMGISPRFFQNAILDYHEWPIKWWREVVQNSVDARAREMRLEVYTDPQDRGYWIAAQDDGEGMDENILFNKFLYIGETGKEQGEGTVGGFGKAKELLLLPWIEWTVRTGDTHVVGSGRDYEFSKEEHIDGTRVAVLMPFDQRTTISSAMELLQRSSIRRTRFMLKDHDESSFTYFTDRLRPGKLIEEIEDKAKIYHNKSQAYSAVLVRVQGLFMFRMGLRAGFPGTVIVELTGNTLELLTANRDGFRDYDLQYHIEDMIHEISAEGERALKRRDKRFKKKYVGGGKFRPEVREAQAAIIETMGAVPQPPAGEKLEVKDEARARVLQHLEREAKKLKENLEEETVIIGPAVPAAAELMLDVKMVGPEHVEAVAKQLVWTPDFMVFNEYEDWTPPKQFYPETMAAGVKGLAQLWGELCRWVLIQLGSGEEYGVGFIFDDSTRAMFLTEEGENWLLLNPFRDVQKRGDLLKKSDVVDLKRIYASAVHEATHMADGVGYHDVAFATALTSNIAKTIDGWKKVRGIASGIKTRSEGGAATSEVTWDERARVRMSFVRGEDDSFKAEVTLPRKVVDFFSRVFTTGPESGAVVSQDYVDSLVYEMDKEDTKAYSQKAAKKWEKLRWDRESVTVDVPIWSLIPVAAIGEGVNPPVVGLFAQRNYDTDGYTVTPNGLYVEAIREPQFEGSIVVDALKIEQLDNHTLWEGVPLSDLLEWGTASFFLVPWRIWTELKTSGIV